MRSSRRATSSALRTRGSFDGRFGEETSRPGSAAGRRARASSGRTSAARRACGRWSSARAPLGHRGRVAAQDPRGHGRRHRARRRSPRSRTGAGRRRTRGACAPRRRGGAGRPRTALEGRDPGVARFCGDGAVLHRHSARAGRHAEAARWPRASRRRAATCRGRGTGSRARTTPRPCGTRSCAGRRRACSSVAWSFAIAPPCPLVERLGGRARGADRRLELRRRPARADRAQAM